MLTDPEEIRSILSRYLNNADDCDAVVSEMLAAGGTTEISGAAVDLDRAARCGFPEVVYGQGKSSELVTEIFRRQHLAGQRAFATRVSAEQAEAVRESQAACAGGIPPTQSV